MFICLGKITKIPTLHPWIIFLRIHFFREVTELFFFYFLNEKVSRHKGFDKALAELFTAQFFSKPGE